MGRDSLPERTLLDSAGTLHWTIVVPPGSSCNADLTIEFNAPDCELDLGALFLCTGDEQVSLNVNVRHNSGNCRSRQQIRGIVGGRARAGFNGLIYVKRDAQHTKAYQECHSILLNEGARVEARPQLEIYADDVECSHGATSGFLDPVLYEVEGHRRGCGKVAAVAGLSCPGALPATARASGSIH